MIDKTWFRGVLFVTLVALLGVLFGFVLSIEAGATQGKTTICHPVGSATGGNTHAGYSIITPANPSAHIDEETGAPKHEHDGRVDFVVTEDTPCPPVQDEVIRDPRARLFGPCGDPMYAAGFDNSRSNVSMRFTLRFYNPAWGWRTLSRVVEGGHRYISRYVYVQGATLITIRAGANTLVSKISKVGPHGGFPPCPDLRGLGWS
jgi:hypothetical protein